VLKNTLILHKSAGKSKLFLVNPKPLYRESPRREKPANAKFEFNQLYRTYLNIDLFLLLVCHSGLTEIFLCFQKDSRLTKAFGIAGMTVYKRKTILR
jgi:hypothetical protein